MASKVSKCNKKSFLQSVFSTLDTSQKGWIILHDKEYIKKMLLYHGNQLFHKSIDNPSLVAQTVLGIMLICLNGDPNFFYKIDFNSKINTSLFIWTNWVNSSGHHPLYQLM